MIVKRVWEAVKSGGLLWKVREGWFLFGIVPLYIRDLTEWRHS